MDRESISWNRTSWKRGGSNEVGCDVQFEFGSEYAKVRSGNEFDYNTVFGFS